MHVGANHPQNHANDSAPRVELQDHDLRQRMQGGVYKRQKWDDSQHRVIFVQVKHARHLLSMLPDRPLSPPSMWGLQQGEAGGEPLGANGPAECAQGGSGCQLGPERVHDQGQLACWESTVCQGEGRQHRQYPRVYAEWTTLQAEARQVVHCAEDQEHYYRSGSHLEDHHQPRRRLRKDAQRSAASRTDQAGTAQERLGEAAESSGLFHKGP